MATVSFILVIVVFEPTSNDIEVSGGVSLPAGTPTAAQFDVTGEGTSSFSISLPTSSVLTSGSNTLTVGSFVSTPSTIGSLTAGTATISVGATPTVPANTPSGIYTNASDLTVTVNY